MPVKDIVSDQKNPSRNRALVLGALILILVLLALGSGIVNLQKRHFNFSIGKLSDKVRLFGQNVGPRMGEGKVRVVSEESVTIDVVKRVTPSVVTIGITKNQPVFDIREQDPFDPFGVFSQPRPQGSKQIKQDIGTGFIVQSDGLIITNKHVVADTSAKYRVVTTDNKTFDVQKIYRDPNNDLAILKIETTGLVPVEMGDSSKLQVGHWSFGCV
jgi:S1-C subfamily serine protease